MSVTSKVWKMTRSCCHWSLAISVSLLWLLPTDSGAMPVGCSGRPTGSVQSDGVASSAATSIARLPAYRWYHGCGPTSAASILGYWDLNGYPELFDAAGAEVYLTENVQDQISSPAHNAKYDPTPDAAGPVPPATSIADWFRTSVDPQRFGWSYLSNADDAFEGYAGYRGYQFEASNRRLSDRSSASEFGWQDYTAAVDVDEPVMFLVDTNGDGSTDHFVPAFGYDDRGDEGLFYGFYTSWSEQEEVIWKPFRPLGNRWGVGYATFVTPLDTPVEPVPEPTSILVWVLILGMVMARRTTFRSASASG